MGCGVSRPSNEPVHQMQRHPLDYTLEYIELQPVGLLEFDLTFASLEETMNRLVELNNDVNDCVLDTISACASCTQGIGLLEVEIQAGIPDHDRVLLALMTREGHVIQPQEVSTLLQSKPACRSADLALEKARQILIAELRHCLRGEAQAAVSLSVTPTDLLQANPACPAAEAFNAALSAFRDSLGGAYTLHLHVRHSVAPGAPTVDALITTCPAPTVRPATAQLASDVMPSRPATLLEVLASHEGTLLHEAHATLADRAQRLALVTRDLAALSWQVLRKHKVTISTVIDDSEQRSALRRALVQVNATLFSMVSHAACSQGNTSLAAAVGNLARQWCQVLKAQWEGRGGLPAPLQTLLSFEPNLHFRQAGAFSFGIEAKALPEADMQPFPAGLSQQGQELFMRIESLCNAVSHALTTLPSISEQLEEEMEKAREFYELAPEVAAAKGMPMMQAAKTGKAVGANLKVCWSCVSERQSLFKSFNANVQRVVDDLAEAPAVAAKALAEQAALQAA